ncbi:MAG: hypothetical protein U5L09_10600 [Bacteroidales bacterium]|nr:hypothetical protein [Bacteroidales bacterium]
MYKDLLLNDVLIRMEFAGYTSGFNIMYRNGKIHINIVIASLLVARQIININPIYGSFMALTLKKSLAGLGNIVVFSA